eukprot:TRINITY_DN6940_c0_g1_i1.p1 TRINITY_DN6940_c0_g1~~TRINITY_DN6940_c0_g1_i1.p1  ORF type:complete len:188 (-),score=25.39 TRINITY_DN6940_c0_g1_i1:84-647(-)
MEYLPTNLEEALRYGRYVSSLLVVISSSWSFVLPPTYTAWLCAFFSLFAVITLLLTDLPRVRDSPRIKATLSPYYGSVVRIGAALIFMGFCTIRDPKPCSYETGSFGPFAIAAGVISIVNGILHVALGFTVLKNSGQQPPQDIEADRPSVDAGYVARDGPIPDRDTGGYDYGQQQPAGATVQTYDAR